MGDLPDMKNLQGDAFKFADAAMRAQDGVYIFGKAHAVCATDTIGHAEPRGATPEEIVVDGTEGFIPLWDKDVTLRWRFGPATMARFARPEQAAAGLRQLMGEALLGWGDAVPVKFVERRDAYDFEINVREADRCSMGGCVLASAFFPDGGQHELRIYPKFFEQDRVEQVETLMHEFGHVFGLRHFFALVSETSWPAIIYGEHNPDKPFSIMNYGRESVITNADRRDLRNLYKAAWSGELEEINGTRIELMRPYHESAAKLPRRDAAVAASLGNGSMHPAARTNWSHHRAHG